MNGIFIFVLEFGFVLVGRAKVSDQLAFHWDVEDARIIRRWGTTAGLAQLAESGPLSNTVLDSAADELIPWKSVIRMIKVSEDKWSSHI